MHQTIPAVTLPTPPGIWTFENYFVQIPTYQDQKAIEMPYT